LNGLGLMGVMAFLGSCASMNQTAQTFPDDVYGRDAEAVVVAQSDNERYEEEEYYEDNYSNQDYYDGYYDGMSYATRISRFYYGTPGLPYYDPWINHWAYYSPFYSGLSFGFGWNSWYSPYYGYSRLGWGNPYYGGYWGPYSYYGGGYYGGGYYGGGGYYTGNIRDRRVRPTRIGTDNVRRTTRPSIGS